MQFSNYNSIIKSNLNENEVSTSRLLPKNSSKYTWSIRRLGFTYASFQILQLTYFLICCEALIPIQDVCKYAFIMSVAPVRIFPENI